MTNREKTILAFQFLRDIGQQVEIVGNENYLDIESGPTHIFTDSDDLFVTVNDIDVSAAFVSLAYRRHRNGSPSLTVTMA
jgi:hypothetical protein